MGQQNEIAATGFSLSIFCPLHRVFGSMRQTRSDFGEIVRAAPVDH